MCDFTCIAGWCSTIYSSITILFYCLFIFMLIYNRKTPEFNHAFFKLLISLSVADILQLMVALFVNQFLVFHGWVASFCVNVLGNIGAHVLTLLLWGSAMAQHLTVLSMAINRYSAYVHPLLFKWVEYWSDGLVVYAAIWLPWVLSCTYVIPMAFMGHFFFPYTINNVTTIFCSWQKPSDLQHYYNILIPIIIIIAVLLALLYGKIFIKTRQQMRRTAANLKTSNHTNDRNNNKTAKLVLKMTICGAVAAFGLILLGILYSCSKIYYALTSSSIPNFSIIMSALVNFYGGINPYVFIISSRMMRNRLLKMLGLKCLIVDKNIRAHVQLPLVAQNPRTL